MKSQGHEGGKILLFLFSQKWNFKFVIGVGVRAFVTRHMCLNNGHRKNRMKYNSPVVSIRQCGNHLALFNIDCFDTCQEPRNFQY